MKKIVLLIGACLFADGVAAQDKNITSEFLETVRVVDEVSLSGLVPFPVSGVGSDPAAISIRRSEGEDHSVVKAAVTWHAKYSPFGDSLLGIYGWGPVAGYAIDRNSVSSEPTDVRNATAGLAGSVFDYTEAPFGIASLLAFTYRTERQENSRSNLLVSDNALVATWLYYGAPYTKGQNGYFVIPRFGLVAEDVRRAPDGGATGNRVSAFAGFKLEFFPGKVSEKTKLSLAGRRYVDTSADEPLEKRGQTYWKLAADYTLFGSDDIKTSIGLDRSIGADLLNGGKDVGLTQLTFKLQIH